MRGFSLNSVQRTSRSRLEKNPSHPSLLKIIKLNTTRYIDAYGTSVDSKMMFLIIFLPALEPSKDNMHRKGRRDFSPESWDEVEVKSWPYEGTCLFVVDYCDDLSKHQLVVCKDDFPAPEQHQTSLIWGPSQLISHNGVPSGKSICVDRDA